MRLDIPDHLQWDFHSQMDLSFDQKKRHPSLKRNVKFDEEDYGLYMDLKLNDEVDWKRVKPSQAAAANKGRRQGRTQSLQEEEIRGPLDSSDDK